MFILQNLFLSSDDSSQLYTPIQDVLNSINFLFCFYESLKPSISLFFVQPIPDGKPQLTLMMSLYIWTTSNTLRNMKRALIF